MKMKSTVQDDVLVITLEEERLDAAGALSFKEQMRQFSDAHEGRVVLDVEAVRFLDSSGLGALVAVMKTLGSGRKLELAACQPAVLKVLKLTRMDSVFQLHDDLTPFAGPGSPADVSPLPGHGLN